jgi:hypothetical protein
MVKAVWNKINIPKNQQATLLWAVPYAAAVHNGASLRNGGEIIPRPWVTSTARNFEFTSIYIDSFNPASLNFIQAFQSTAIAFGEACQASVKSSIWQWNRITVRRSGEVVSSPRNIIDLGNLFNSYSINFS